ncbi:DVUA0089 family protein [uncultured Shimia sp.]|uniref:DVUA0089 family protein n=1 Tax=uncultured Shimia sp. TaxID=573152 RepID=UPI0026144813|nr:DVUA0089 family protein [uncultured Shimia sp.]
MTKRIHILLASAVYLVASSMVVQAASFSFSGELSQDDTVEYIYFTVGENLITTSDTSTSVVIRTYSYGGGIQPDGTVVPAGGFDPILTLYDAAENFIGETDDDTTGLAQADPSTRATYDAGDTFDLAPGTYTAAVSQWSNYAYLASTLSDEFVETGDGFFTGEFGCSNGQFCDWTGANRSSLWAFGIENVESAWIIAPVPLPASALLLLGGGLFLLPLGWIRVSKHA